MNRLTRFERNIDRMISSAVSGDDTWIKQREIILKKIDELIVKDDNRRANPATVPMMIHDFKVVAQQSNSLAKLKLTLSPSDCEARVKFFKNAPNDVIDFVMRGIAKFKDVNGHVVLSVSYRGELFITPSNTIKFTLRTEKHDKALNFEYIDERTNTEPFIYSH